MNRTTTNMKASVAYLAAWGKERAISRRLWNDYQAGRITDQRFLEDA